MTELGRLEAIDPRVVWAHEAHDFTPWLLVNTDALATALGLDIELTGAEHPVGGYALDLVGRDLTNDCVLIVENQLTGTDHGHLGQLVTYAAGTDAGTVVWLATSFREEHRQAIDFLNGLGRGNVRFFGVEIGVVRIGDSPAAPLFKVVAQPNEFHSTAATAAEVSSGASGKGKFYLQFWERFLARVHAERPGWTNARRPRRDNWIAMPSPIGGGGMYYSCSFSAGARLRNELYLGSPDAAANTAVLEVLRGRAEEIEAAFGGPLSWEDLPSRVASRVACYANGDVTNVDRHDDYIDWFIESGDRLRAALESHVADANVAAAGRSRDAAEHGDLR